MDMGVDKAVIRAYFGLPGSGKTYSMTKDAMKEGKGKVVYSNYDVRIPGAKEIIKLDYPLSLIEAKNGLVLIDEAGLWMPSIIWRKIPEALIWKLAQVRKEGIDLFYTAQNPARVVKILRELTFESVWCIKFFSLFLQKIMSGIDDSLISWRFLILSKKIYEKYDTYQKVTVLEG